MVIDYESINKHLQLVRKYVGEIINWKEGLTKKLFKNTLSRQYSIAFAFFQSVQNCLDIGNHIISELNLERAESSKEVFNILASEKIISEKTKTEFYDFIEIRNRVVHIYGKVNVEEIYDVIKNKLDNFLYFEKEIVKFLKKRKK